MKDRRPATDTFSIRAGSSRLDPGSRVLKADETFVVLDRLGDIAPGGAGELGLYHRGTRFLSRLSLTLDGGRPFLLSSRVREYDAVFVADLTNPDVANNGHAMKRGSVHLVRECRLFPSRLELDLRLRNYSASPVTLALELAIDCDFADIFEVRGTTRRERGNDLPARRKNGALLFAYSGLDGVVRGTRFASEPAPTAASTIGSAAGHEISYDVALDPGQERLLRFHVSCRVGKTAARSRGLRRKARFGSPKLRASNDAFDYWLRRSAADLRMMTTRTAWGPYPYAGVPWFSAPFGRDGILAAQEVLWLDPAPARGVLRFLGAHQASTSDRFRDAEPGKILHEARSGEMATLGEVPFGRYYGSVDATPLFVILAGAYFERTADRAFAQSCWPHVERALEWMDRWGDPDGDGFLEYSGRSDRGLVNQGWKDSADALFHANGASAEGPIALCEVQGYAYAARRAAAGLASALGRVDAARRLNAEADRLQEAFEASFWDEELETYAMALDGEKRPCRVRSSNAGHALFSGIAAPDRASRLAKTLFEPDSFSGWGIRTVASGQARYNPMAYHNGSVWPHDNAIIAAGLGRYGFRAEAARLLHTFYELSRAVESARLPELVCGFSRRSGEGPTLFPLACAPQAWAAGAASFMLQASLGARVSAVERRVVFDRPALPPVLESLSIEGLRVGTAVADLRLTRSGTGVAVETVRRVGRIEVETLR